VNVNVEIPDRVLDAIAERVVVRVFSELVATRSTGASGAASPLMTVAEAAEYMRCGFRTTDDGTNKIRRQRVDDLLSQRKLTRFKDGRRTLVSRDEIDAYLGIAQRRAL